MELTVFKENVTKIINNSTLSLFHKHIYQIQTMGSIIFYSKKNMDCCLKSRILHFTTSNVVVSVHDFGIIFSNDLSIDAHIDLVYSKSLRVLGFIRSNRVEFKIVLSFYHISILKNILTFYVPHNTKNYVITSNIVVNISCLTSCE
ncbi:putative RNA-directed DNA polymerase, partial [Aphis craccivora]